MPVPSDHIIVLLFVVGETLYAKFVWYPRLSRRDGSGPDTLARLFTEGMIVQWVLTLAALWVWQNNGRSFAGLGLAPAPDTRFWIGVGAVIVLIGLITWQRLAVVRSAALSERVMGQLSNVRAMLPNTPRDLLVFGAVSITAGFCEEVFYRGVLLWYLGTYLPAPVVYLAATALFGWAHVYQGPRGMLQAALMGAVFVALVWVSNSLWPAIIFHAVFDMNSGLLAYTILRRRVSPAL